MPIIERVRGKRESVSTGRIHRRDETSFCCLPLVKAAEPWALALVEKLPLLIYWTNKYGSWVMTRQPHTAGEYHFVPLSSTSSSSSFVPNVSFSFRLHFRHLFSFFGTTKTRTTHLNPFRCVRRHCYFCWLGHFCCKRHFIFASNNVFDWPGMDSSLAVGEFSIVIMSIGGRQTNCIAVPLSHR